MSKDIAFKKNELLSMEATCMEVEDDTIREITQALGDKCPCPRKWKPEHWSHGSREQNRGSHRLRRPSGGRLANEHKNRVS